MPSKLRVKRRRVEGAKAVEEPKAKEQPLKKTESEESSESSEEEGSEGDSENEEQEESEDGGEDQREYHDDEEDEEDEEDGEEDEPGKKRKRTQTEAFSTAISAILGSRVKAHDRDNPILVRSKKTAKNVDKQKEDSRAKRALKQEKKMREDKDRVKDILPKGDDAVEVLDYERQLKQKAKRGVVRLFNAILASQQGAAQQTQQKVLGMTKKEEQVNEISKEKFLDLIRTGGK